MLWSDSGCSRILLVDFQEMRFFNIFDPHDGILVTWRRVLRTPLPLLEGVPQVETFDKAPWSLQSPGACADAQCCKINIQKWLEELASERNTIQA